MRALLLLATLLVVAPRLTSAQTACPAGTATDTLAANNVRALLLNNGGLFWKGAGNVYNVPAARPGSPITPNALFAANLWVGGRVGDVLHAAGSNYSAFDYFPGALDAQGQPSAACAAQDRIYRITRADLNALGSGTVTAAVRDWPWQLGAPVVNGDGVAGNYNLAGGDRPELLGSQTSWWVMHTNGPHTRSGSAPFPLEVQVSAFAVASAEAALNEATLYRYRFVWRGPGTFTDAYVGLWADLDLGNAGDDYVGADSARALVYGYNADNFDEGSEGYGANPPAIGVSLAQTPRVGTREGAFSAQIDPKNDPVWGTENLAQYTPQTYYNRLLGLSTDGRPHPRCGDALSAQFLSCGTTRFTFTGMPETRSGWTMLTPLPLTAPITPADTRMMLSAGPFTFQQGAPQDVVFAITYARGSNHLDAVAQLRTATDRVHNTWRTTGFQNLPAFMATAPQAAPRALAPTEGAAGQASPLTFAWSVLQDASHYTLDVQAAGRTIATRSTTSTQATVALPDSVVSVGQTISWRVRGENRVGAGPWSAMRTFTLGRAELRAQTMGFVNFLTTRNAAGALTPPEYGAFAFNASGFPNPTTGDRPTGRQQSTTPLGGSAGWGVFTPGNYRTFAEWQRIVTRNLANAPALGGSFEWRFTGTSVAARPYDTGGPATMTVPFELWSTGTRADASDDVRMIPLVCEAACGAGTLAGTFDLGGDSPLSGGTDDPLTDAVTWHFPSDRTPGPSGYLAWAAQAGTPGAGALLGAEALAHVSLMGWNMGTSPSTYRMPLPETGTVFQIQTQPVFVDAPVPSGPALSATNVPTPVTLYWNEPAATQRRDVQVARDAAFADLVVQDTASAGAYRVSAALTPGQRYYWRVRAEADGVVSPWSAAQSFTAGVASGTGGPAAAPAVFALGHLAPHPVRTAATVSLALPTAGTLRVRLYDLLGRTQAVLFDGATGAGTHALTLDASGLAPGVYVLRAALGGQSVTRSVVVAR